MSTFHKFLKLNFKVHIVYSKDFTLAIFHKLEIARKDSERLGVWKKYSAIQRELKFPAYRAVCKYYTKIESFYTMKCHVGIGTLFASRVCVQYTIFSAWERKNKAVMCKPTIWIALERVRTRGFGRKVQSLVWRWVYEIADVIVCIRVAPSFRISWQILAKGVCAYCVHNTCATRGHGEGARTGPMLLLNSYKNAMTELSGSVVSLNRCWSDFYFFFVFVRQREISTRIFARPNVFLKPWIIKTLYSRNLRSKLKITFHFLHSSRSRIVGTLNFFESLIPNF